MIKDYNKADYKKNTVLQEKFDEIVIKITENEDGKLSEAIDKTSHKLPNGKNK